VIGLLEVIKDRVTIWWLRRKIILAKAARYDDLVESMVGLRRAIATYKHMTASLQTDLETSRLEANTLRSEYFALKSRISGREQTAIRTERLAFLRRILPVVVQIPTINHAVSSGVSLLTKDVLEVLRPLDQMLTDMRFERIGEVGQELPFDPTRHHLMEDESSSSQLYERVIVRFVGYIYENEVLAKAEVTGVSELEVAQGQLFDLGEP
jgi:molecular chaperone GrpE (heat shock protein)